MQAEVSAGFAPHSPNSCQVDSFKHDSISNMTNTDDDPFLDFYFILCVFFLSVVMDTSSFIGASYFL